MKKIDIEFDFKGCHYLAVIRVVQVTAGRDFHVTVLNWELERLLYGNHIIKEVEGFLEANILLENKEQTELKLNIAARLSSNLKLPCFAGDQCLAVDHMGDGWENLHPIPRHRHWGREESGIRMGVR
jgi:hypothetical protein